MILVPFLLVSCALAVAWWRTPNPRRRLRRLRELAQRQPGQTVAARRIDPVRWAAIAGGVSVGLLVDGWYGIAAGIATWYVLDRALRRLESRTARAARLRAAADLPFAIDLLAACVRAGSPPAVAVRSAGVVVGGMLGERLIQVAASLGLGAAPADAWAHLHGVPGASRVAAAAVRSSESGAALARSLIRLADELRAARTTACEAAARRAGVLVVLPLGLCFLPAFVLAGLVPIVLSVLGDVMP
jgi:Flp pilus assembly protein TadB